MNAKWLAVCVAGLGVVCTSGTSLGASLGVQVPTSQVGEFSMPRDCQSPDVVTYARYLVVHGTRTSGGAAGFTTFHVGTDTLRYTTSNGNKVLECGGSWVKYPEGFFRTRHGAFIFSQNSRNELIGTVAFSKVFSVHPTLRDIRAYASFSDPELAVQTREYNVSYENREHVHGQLCMRHRNTIARAISSVAGFTVAPSTIRPATTADIQNEQQSFDEYGTSLYAFYLRHRFDRCFIAVEEPARTQVFVAIVTARNVVVQNLLASAF